MAGMPPGGVGGPPPQQWHPGMGPPPQQFRHGSRPPMMNQQAGPPRFAAPGMQGMPMFPGYEGVGAFGNMARMPPPPPPPPPVNVPPMDFGSVAFLDEESCRSALMQWVSENCCYGKDCVQEMTFDNIQSLTALHYTLETFTEGRSTGYAHQPYRGGHVDGPEGGPPPPPWAIMCPPDQRFHTHVKKMPVPHTESVQPCNACNARGYVRCHHCDGWGQTICHSCDGGGRRMETDPEGNPFEAPCPFCGGDGKKSCITCGGDGRITCTQCDGFRNLKCFIELTVKYENHKDDHIIENSDMPDELIRGVGGTPIFEQALPAVPPIIAYPVREINDNSVRLVNQHRGAWPNAKQCEQRQILRGVPVTECAYSWKETNSRFWVYGKERKIHCPDYPQTCSCTIL